MQLAPLLNIRNALNKNSLVTSVVLGVVIITLLLYGAYYLGYLGSKGNHALAAQNAYYFDEETGEVEVRPAAEIPPLTAKSGNLALVRAHFFTTGSDSAKKLIYLERYTADGKAGLEATNTHELLSPAAIDALRHGPQVRSPEPGSPWVYQNSPEGQAVIHNFSALGSDSTSIRAVTPP